MTRILFVRHGETDWNKEHRIQGQTDTKLTEEGKKQAKRIAERLKDEKIDAIYTSTLSRAIDTAKKINKYHNLKIEKCKEFNELSFGMYEGMKWDEVKEKHPKVFEEREKNKYEFKPEKGESFKELWQRFHKKLLEIEKKHPNENVLIVAHGGAKIGMMINLLHMKFDEIIKNGIRNTAITIFDIEKGKVEFHTINDHSHLT